jgi:TetR/AcrR family transcriptional repressor of mexJK operon
MSATSGRAAGRERGRRRPRIRAEDPRIVRSRAAVVHAARALFLSKGFAGTTMEEIAARAGLTKRTVYNNYADKDALFTQIVTEITDYAAEFARDLRAELTLGITAANLRGTLDDLGRRLALGIVRPEVVALRRLLIGEARAFPALARRYYERAPGQVLDALAAGFEHLGRAGLLQVPDARRAAAQFAYLVAGEPLDRAMLAGTLPARRHVVASAREGVETFLARYASARRGLPVVRSTDPAKPRRSRLSSRNRPSS